MSSTKEYVPVADFYAGRSVFLTGVSGFLGKVIMEKLIYSCNDIDKVYVLIREKKGVNAEERFQDIIKLPAFTRLREERPEDLNKIVLITGDLTAPNLGIEKCVEETFINKVSVVLHSAAIVKYNQPLDEALNNNLEGTRRVLELCRRMPRIRSFVHVSTAYSNSEREVIDEVVYPTPALSDVYASIKRHGVTDQEIIKKILNGKANSYVFSKALAENMLVEEHGDIPTTIVRPSTVAAAMSEPLPGWVDNWFAATGIFHTLGKGYNRVIYGRSSNVLGVTPVDYVSNLVIVAAARKKESKDIPVYNSCTSSCNPVTCGQLFMYVKEYYVANKNYDLYPSLYFSQKTWVVNFLTFLLQMLPAKMADVYLRVKGQKPRYAKMQSKFIEIRDIQRDFTKKSFFIKNDGVRSLYSSLSSTDKQKFPFDPMIIDWKKFITTYCHGDMTTAKEYVPVADFYADRSVFLTGVSGFLGKVILEKLLYSCKHIDKVYVMIREKKGVSAEERLQDIIKIPVFTRLKEERPEDLNKIVPVTGDLMTPNLGIKKSVEDILINKVSVVLHSAATVKYNQLLTEALENNLEGTKKVLELCRRMPQISSFVYVSTAYSNSEREVIDEVVYPTPALSDVYAFIKRHGVTDEKTVKKILSGKPNTYAFSKALTENMLVEQHGDVPTTIVRPSTVASALSEPLPGWVDNWFAATGIIHVTGSGYNRVMYSHKSKVLDLIPVDYVSNLVIVAGARNKESRDIPVYNSCSSSCNPINFGELFLYVKDYHVKNNCYDVYPSLYFSQNMWVVNILTFLLQMLPAKAADMYLKAKRQNPRYAKWQSKVIQTRDIQKNFTNGSWVIKSERTRSLYSSLSSTDKQKFPFDPMLVDWKRFIATYCHGIRRFLLKK